MDNRRYWTASDDGATYLLVAADLTAALRALADLESDRLAIRELTRDQAAEVSVYTDDGPGQSGRQWQKLSDAAMGDLFSTEV